MMSEVIVAMFSASILIPDEKMFPIQWLGAFAILLAGFMKLFSILERINIFKYLRY